MIEAIKEIGEYVLKGKELNQDNFLNNICIKLDEKKQNKNQESIPQHVVFLNFDTTTKKIKISSEQVNCKDANDAKGDSGKAYLWAGNFEGAKPQVNITSNKLDYLLTESFSLIKDHKKINGEFKKNLEEVIIIFFNKEKIKKENKEEIVYSVRSETFEFFDKKLEEDVNDIKNKLKETNTKKEAEKYIKDLVNILKDNLLKSISLNSDDVSIYTIKINDQLVCQTKEYKDMLYYEKIDCLFDKTNKNYKKNLNPQGICSICSDDASKKKQTTSNTTNLRYKFYMTDKIGFSFGLDETFKRNLNLCKDCYQYLMIGEQFIRDNLKTHIGEISTYIIPHFGFTDINLNLADFSKYVSDYTNSVARLEKIKDLERNLKRYANNEKNNFVLNYLFYQKSKSEFKVLKLIKDIPPTRLDFIRKKEEEISNLVDEKYGEKNKFKIYLDTVWGCIPLKQEKKKKTYEGASRYLDVLDAIFSNGRINYDSLINQFTEVIRIIKFEREGYNILTKENLADKILQLNFLLLFFKKLNILNSTNKMENMNNQKTDELKDLIPQEILNYWENIEIYGDNCKKALFLLGHLIGEIGYAQDKKDIKNRPILNKITFQGMDVEKLKRLSNEVFEKLIQYDIRKYNEKIHSTFKNLFEEHISKWNLSNQENAFYVLSGYAFSSHISFQRYKKGIEDDLKKKEEEIQEAKKNGEDVAEQEKLLEEAKKMFNNKKEDSYKKTKEILKKIKIKEND